MKLGYTGTQSGMNKFQKNEVEKFFTHYNPDELHHGDCIGGDSQCHYMFLNWHCDHDTKQRTIVIHPGTLIHKRAYTIDFTKYSNELKDRLRNCKYKITMKELEPLPPLIRNGIVVNEVDAMIATPKEFDHTLRSGTWATIRKAWHTKKEIHIIPPIIREEN